MKPKTPADPHCGDRHRIGDIAARKLPGRQDVRPRLVVQERRALEDSSLGVDQGFERFISNLDPIEGVFRDRPALRRHCDHGLADIANLLAR